MFSLFFLDYFGPFHHWETNSKVFTRESIRFNAIRTFFRGFLSVPLCKIHFAASKIFYLPYGASYDILVAYIQSAAMLRWFSISSCRF